MTDIITYDVFISYSHKDIDWVQKYLIPILKSWKLTIAVDHIDFLPGQRLIRSIWDYIHNSNQVIFLCSYNFLKSEWCREELEIVRSKDPGVITRKAIPIVFYETSYNY